MYKSLDCNSSFSSNFKTIGLQISAGFQELSLADRGGRRRDFHDLGINTRQAIEHVQESKTGMFRLDYRHISKLK